MNGPHRRRTLDLRDFNPHTSGYRSGIRDQASRHLREVEHSSAGSMFGDAVTVEIVRPQGEDRYDIKAPFDPDIVVTVPSNGDYRFNAGQRATAIQTRQGLLIIGSPVSGERGKSNHSSQSLSEIGDLLEITSCDPEEIQVDTPTVVTFFGRGFREDDVIIPVIKDEFQPNDLLLETDPDWTISSITFISVTEVTATVTTSVIGTLSVRPERA